MGQLAVSFRVPGTSSKRCALQNIKQTCPVKVLTLKISDPKNMKTSGYVFPTSLLVVLTKRSSGDFFFGSLEGFNGSLEGFKLPKKKVSKAYDWRKWKQKQRSYSYTLEN